GLRLVSLAQAACEPRGWSVADRLAVVRQDQVATFLLKKSPFTADEILRLRGVSERLGFDVLYAPNVDPSSIAGESSAAAGSSEPQSTRPAQDVYVDGAATGDYARLITAPDRKQFYESYA